MEPGFSRLTLLVLSFIPAADLGQRFIHEAQQVLVGLICLSHQFGLAAAFFREARTARIG